MGTLSLPCLPLLRPGWEVVISLLTSFPLFLMFSKAAPCSSTHKWRSQCLQKPCLLELEGALAVPQSSLLILQVTKPGARNTTTPLSQHGPDSQHSG